MPTTTYRDLLQSVTAGKFPPLLILHGEEPWYASRIQDEVEHRCIPAELRDFNQTILYGRDTQADQILECARRFPMMSERVLVSVREAQGLSDRELEKLAQYALQPVPTTVLMMHFSGKTLDKRKIFTKNAEKSGVMMPSEPLREKNLPDWIRSYVHELGLGVTPDAIALLSEFVGCQPANLASDLGILAINLSKGSNIQASDVEQFLGASRVYNLFELSKAIGLRNMVQTLNIVQYFARDPKAGSFSMPGCIGSLYLMYSKTLHLHELGNRGDAQTLAQRIGINPFALNEYLTYARNYPPKRIKKCLQILQHYDMKSKGLDNPATGDGELLREMVFRLLNA
ncbi:MAG: DNA polymerase III subunit delta [Sphingomonadales bacterium]|nr:DNA polymerase III subunit delta [Sphingomonadales bacterium]